jgi:MHS family alpha-ketoglutarate permease-like MFS transporter
VFAVGSLARPVGAVALGRYIDRNGRRAGLVVSVTLMVVASFGIAMLPPFATIGLLAPLALVALRLMQGFALGPELGGSAAYLAEIAPEGRRGFFTATYQSSVALGTLGVAGLISTLEIFLDDQEMASYGWRVVFAVGGLVALGGLALRRTLPETDSASEAERRLRKPFTLLWRYHRAAVMRIVVIGGAGLVVMYGFVTLLPSLGPTFTKIAREQAAHVNTFASVVMLVAPPFCGLLGDRIGRVWTIRLFAGAGLLAIPLLGSLDGSVDRQLVTQLVGAIIMCIWAGAAFSSLAEMLPLATRAAGIAAPFGLAAALAGGFSPMVATSLASAWGVGSIGWFVAIATMIAGAATIGMAETAHGPLRVE